MLGMSSLGAADPYSEPVIVRSSNTKGTAAVSYTHLRAHETQ